MRVPAWHVWCVYVRAWEWLYVCMHVCGGLRLGSGAEVRSLPLLLVPTYSLKQGLITEPRATQLVLGPSWVIVSQLEMGHQAQLPLTWVRHGTLGPAAISMGSGELNWGPCECAAGTFATEPLPGPSATFYSLVFAHVEHIVSHPPLLSLFLPLLSALSSFRPPGQFYFHIIDASIICVTMYLFFKRNIYWNFT